MTPTILFSEEDDSINLISPQPGGGSFESRYVRRNGDEFIIYLSSMSGCNLSCRFCWLTQLNQTEMVPATTQDYVNCAMSVINEAELMSYDLSHITTVHVNFMARGDFFSNPHAVKYPTLLFNDLTDAIKRALGEVKVKFKISTIFPDNSASRHPALRDDIRHLKELIIGGESYPTIRDWGTEIYYSLYSLRPDFRKKWLPKAVDPEIVGEAFRGTHEGLRLHYALIAGQNDTEEDVALIHNWLERYDLKVIYNLVAYNPYSFKSGEESDAISRQTYLNQLNLSHRVISSQVIPIRGKDIKVSCGMFVED